MTEGASFPLRIDDLIKGYTKCFSKLIGQWAAYIGLAVYRTELQPVIFWRVFYIHLREDPRFDIDVCMQVYTLCSWPLGASPFRWRSRFSIMFRSASTARIQMCVEHRLSLVLFRGVLLITTLRAWWWFSSGPALCAVGRGSTFSALSQAAP